MHTAYETLIFANKIGISLWVAEGDKLNYKATNHPKTADTLKDIVALKPEIIDVLKRNGIHNEVYQLPIIYRCEQVQPKLSFAQERLWFIEQYEGGTNAYHVPRVYQLRPDANIEGIKFAIRTIVSRHEVLRSTLNTQNEVAIQCVHEDELNIDEHTVTSTDELTAVIRKAINRPFDLTCQYPIRVTLYHIEKHEFDDSTTSQADTLLLINIHHIATDGWSMDCFQREFQLCYTAFTHHHTNDIKLPILPIQYKDFAAWQREYFQDDVLQEQADFWLNKLTGFESLNLHCDYARPKYLEYLGKRQFFTIDETVSSKLQAFSKAQGTTLHVILLSVFSIVLSKYSGQTDIVTGSPIANRHFSQLKDSIGCFVNTQVNRTQIDPHVSCEELFSQVHDEQAETQKHQDLPFEKLVELLQVERDSSRHPIFQVMFGVQSFGKLVDDSDALHNSPLLPRDDINQENEIAAFDLSLFVDCSEDHFHGMISYKTSLFCKDTIDQFIRHYGYILEQVLEAPKQPIKNLTLLSPDDYEKLVNQYRYTEQHDGTTNSISQCFLAQVERSPHDIALTYNDLNLSYQALNNKANQLAAQIQKTINQSEVSATTHKLKIGLLLDRSPEMVIAMLAILKCGAAYVPMDPGYPKQRLDHMVSDTKLPLILSLRRTAYSDEPNESVLNTQKRFKEHYRSFADKLLIIDLDETFYETKANEIQIDCHPDDLAYVIYTSGTTGNPKGVLISHANISSLIFSDFLSINRDDTFMFLSSPIFDAATFEIWMPLLHGCKLVIPNDVKSLMASPDDLAILLDKHNITTLWLTNTLFENLYSIKADLFQHLHYLLVGGEALNKEIINRLIESKYRPRHLLNGYGPTESTTFTCIHSMDNKIGTANVPIGKPIKGRTCYILDKDENPVPVGIVGELYIGGAGIAQGYLNNPTLTEERFIHDHFIHHRGAVSSPRKLYKTGDLVRWLPDGSIEYIGRNDAQVKIRGYRIELTEIENKLKTLSGINQVAVLVNTREVGSRVNKMLVAYYTTNKPQPITPQTLTEHLIEQLPDYMIPSAWVELDEFPLTINGKLDTHALAKVEIAANSDGVAPNSTLEKTLCQIYANVLSLLVEDISINANFFAIGGNSILSIQLKHQLNQVKEFTHLSIADTFKFNTVKKLIQSVQNKDNNAYKLQKSADSNDNKIAVVGLSGSVNGADNISELWSLLANQQEGVTFHSQEECRELGVSEAVLANDNYVPISTHIRHTDKFDPLFWNMSPNEAKLLDPQIRKFMEHCWSALESSGYITQRKSQLIGIFAGSGTDHYFQNNIVNRTQTGEINLWEASISNRKDALATKTAYFLGLTGSANSINTACSTGLVSIVEACRNLQLGTCDMALAGGVSLSMPEEIGYTYTEGMIMARDGHCRPFDLDASGTIPGSGVAVVVLKPLSAAMQDNDEILGVISGYATNNDGDRKTSYTAPSLIGQSECIINAQVMAGISPADIDYIECHGTATHLGDPIEVQALKEAFHHQTPENGLQSKAVLGAVKANIGHTDAASGVVGLIKVLQMLRHKMIPGQANYASANVELNLDDTPFEIIQQNRPWEANNIKPRIAGVSAFGIGGTNAHVIVEDLSNQPIPEAALAAECTEGEGQSVIVPISGKSRSALENYRTVLLSYIEQHGDKPRLLNDLAFTLLNNREHYDHRSAYVAGNCEELIQAIKADQSYCQVDIESDTNVIFMFPGQGTQYVNMGKGLYDNEPQFADIVDHCIQIASQYLPNDLHDVLFTQGEHPTNNINNTEWTQICLFVIEYSLAKFLTLMRVNADAYMGHSIGEYVAATLSGIFSLEDAIKVVIARGQLMQSMQPGKMLAVQAQLAQIRQTVESHHCEISVINSHEDIVISGLEEDIQTLQADFTHSDIPSVLLTTSHAYHSRMMDMAAHKFKQVLSTVTINAASKPFVTNLTGKMATSNVQSAEYWCDQLRNTVQFAECIDTISQHFDHKVTFIEVGLGKGLTSFVCKYIESDKRKNIHVFNILPSYKGSQIYDVKSRSDVLAILWKNNQCLAENLDVYRNIASGRNLSDCPTYQFDRQKCWIEKPLNNVHQNQLQLLEKQHWYSTPQWSTCKPFHKSSNRILFSKALILLRHGQEYCDTYASLATSSAIVRLNINVSEYSVIDNNILVNPENEDHFLQLQAHFVNGQYDAIIHAASIDNHERLELALSYSFYSLFLTRTYLLTSPHLKTLLVLTNHIAQISEVDPVNPSNGTLVGAGRNIKHEYAHINTGLLDVGVVGPHTTAYIQQAFQVNSNYRTNTLFAIKYGKLWQESYHVVDQKNLTSQPVISDGDIILVTGGMGGVALSIAHAIAEKHRVTFMLLSRNDICQNQAPSDYVKQKLDIIESIKTKGSTVLTRAVDIANPDQFNQSFLQALIAERDITGIIHTAGVSPLPPEQYNIQNMKNALAGKVYGLNNILSCINTQRLKYLATTSSLASIMGDVNRIEYCAANSYLDYLAVDKLSLGDTAVVSINWPGWSDIGIVRNQEKNNTKSATNELRDDNSLGSLMLLNSVKQQEGASVFYDLIQQPYSQIIFSKLDIKRLEKALFQPSDPAEVTSSNEVVLLEDSHSEQEAQVAQLFADILGVEQLSLDDDFFNIGGNSILAIQLSHKISQTLDRDIKVADIFKYRTIKNILSSVVTKRKLDIPKIADRRVTLSFAQQRLWFIEQYEQGTHAYHIPTLYQLKLGTDIAVLKRVIAKIMDRHEVLRSVIEQDENSELGVQIVCDKPLQVEEVTLSDRASLDVMITRDITCPFDLSNEYPIRIKLYTFSAPTETSAPELTGQHTDHQHILLINMHHIATDGWSLDIFHRELSALYTAYNTNQSTELITLPIQYKDFAHWQRTYLQGEVLQQQLDYWKEKLTGFATLELPIDHQRPTQVDYQGGHQKFTLNANISQAIQSLANEKQTTVHTILLTAFSVLLSKLSNQSDIVTGSPIANRNYAQIKDLIGLFINTQVNRVEVNPELTYHQLIEQVHQDQIAGQQYQDVPFEKLVEALSIDRDLSRHPIFQVMFGVQSFGQLDNKEEDGRTPLLPYEIKEPTDEIARFDLAVFIDDSRDEIQGHVSYKTSLFNAATISSYINRFTQLLACILHSPDDAIRTLSILTREEEHIILHDWNHSQCDYPNQSTIAELFQRQVELCPDNIALVCRETQLTYQELNSKSNALANVIRQTYKQRTGADMKPGTLIPLCFDRCLEMVISILAVFKAGGAYVPIDPNYPSERIDYILSDICAAFILSKRCFVQHNKTESSSNKPDNQHINRPLFFDDFAVVADLDEAFYHHAEPNRPPFSAATDLAYVIYTSGTTGQPKGVMVTHRALAYYTYMFIETVSVDKINSAFVLNYCFDASLPTIFSGLLTSGTTTILDNINDFTSQDLVAYLQAEKINTLRLTPSMLMSCQDELVKYNTRLSLVLGGEPINYAAVNALRSNSHIKLFNQYGPTECTVGSTVKPISEDVSVQNIGKPYAGKRLYILDQSKQLSPIGLIGELYIGGEGLATGYLNRSELTQERFVANPYMTKEDKQKGYTRLYKTGDLGRWLDNGDIEYIGRNDDQIKLRGYRIELGEIEHKILALPGIKAACVLLQQQANASHHKKYVVGYYRLEDNVHITGDVILQQLAIHLPEYMLPSHVIEVDAFSLTANGKLDKKALPKPEFTQSEHYETPSNEYERKIGVIWQEILGLERVGMTDDFFRIGGDSITSIQVASRIRRMGLNCQVKNVFEYRTVKRLCQYLLSSDSSVKMQSEEGTLRGELGFLPIQAWFINQVCSGKIRNENHWNQSFLVKVPQLDCDIMPEVIRQLISYHDILRVRYTKQQDTWLQSYQASMEQPELKVLDVRQYSDDELNAVLTDWQSHFDLQQGPLFQCAYLYGYRDSSARLFFSLHHMIVDSVSWRILIENFKTLYEGGTLEKKGTSYRQWVNEVRRYPDINPDEDMFWQRQVDVLADCHSLLDREDKGQPVCFHEITLNQELTSALLQTANRPYHTAINELLLTALVYALKHISGKDIHGITLEGHGREHLSDSIDHSHTVGWFTSKFPVKLQVQHDLAVTIRGIKHLLRSIPNKGIGFGAFVANQSQSPAPSYDFNDMPEISFNYLGRFDAIEGYWQVVNENSGQSVSQDNPMLNVLNINGMINDGKLYFGIHSKLSAIQAIEFSEAFQKTLETVITHCCEQDKRQGYIAHPEDFNDFVPYEMVNETINQQPIFIFPPGGGGAESFYSNLVPHMADHKLVLFNNYYDFINEKKGEQSTDSLTFETLAIFYIDYIKQLQIKGPYLFMGWSFGGVLAFEITKQLTALGDKVSHLVLLDSYFNYKEAWNHSTFTARAQFERNVNYQYQPKPFRCPDPIKVTLFKAKHVDEGNVPHGVVNDSVEGDYAENYRSIHAYYVNNIEDNHVNQYISHADINIIPMEASHNSWVNNRQVIQEIVDVLNTPTHPIG